MTHSYERWAADVERLDRALARLEPLAVSVGIAPPTGQEWYELLRHKLVPQVAARPLLVTAVVGGTNIGKSCVFNHLVGENASAVSPLAAGTKHPVCLVPAGADDPELLAQLFEGFELLPWHDATDALAECPRHRMYWRLGANVPERLLLFDTPDIDSDARINWQRADAVRQAADVLVGVLTQQKYNDASVKQFFRKAAEADKPVLLVLNQVDLAQDAEIWPLWIETFTAETGIRPEMVYVAPYDRRASAELRLPFYPVGTDGRTPLGPPADLRSDLASLHFDAIKVRTLRGALTGVVDRRHGAYFYLAQIRQASHEHAAAAEMLAVRKLAPVRWPSVPSQLLVDEIIAWWDGSRSGWSRKVHGFYRQAGRVISWPVRAAWKASRGDESEPVEAFQTRERQAIVSTIEALLAELDRLAQLGNEILRPRLAELLAGDSRARLLSDVRAAHGRLPAVDDDYRRFVRAELDRWRQENPRAIGWLAWLDHALAVARPAITVSLAVSGGVLVADALSHVVVATATQVATDTAVATAGTEVVTTAAGEGVKQAAARLFGTLQEHYVARRSAWLAEWLEANLLGRLLTYLRSGAAVDHAPELREVGDALRALEVAPN